MEDELVPPAFSTVSMLPCSSDASRQMNAWRCGSAECWNASNATTTCRNGKNGATCCLLPAPAVAGAGCETDNATESFASRGSTGCGAYGTSSCASAHRNEFCSACSGSATANSATDLQQDGHAPSLAW